MNSSLDNFLPDNNMMRICPNCGAICPFLKVCPHCGTEPVDTDTTLDEYAELTDEQRTEWEERVLAQYAPNLDLAAREKMIEENEREDKEREERLQHRPKCPTCGSFDIRETDALEAAYNPRTHHSKTVGKSFVCRNCGYAW